MKNYIVTVEINDVYDWRNAGMIDLYELEHLIVAIVKGGYNH